MKRTSQVNDLNLTVGKTPENIRVNWMTPIQTTVVQVPKGNKKQKSKSTDNMIRNKPSVTPGVPEG